MGLQLAVASGSPESAPGVKRPTPCWSTPVPVPIQCEMGIAIGAGFGLLVGAVIGHVGLAMLVGAGIGLVVCAGLDGRNHNRL